jgi:hypothetical protein
MKRIVLAGILLLAPMASRPQVPVPDDLPRSTAHRHLGLFVRVDAGGGYFGTSTSSPPTTNVSATGIGVPFGVAAGWAVVENFILAGDFWASVAPSPTITAYGEASANPRSLLVFGGLGLNLTYYFMPANIYVSVTPSAVLVNISESSILSSSKVGFGAKLAVGIEFWTADHWGVGAAAQLFLGSNRNGNYDPEPYAWRTLGGGVAISATYN